MRKKGTKAGLGSFDCGSDYTEEEVDFLREIIKLKAQKPCPSMREVFRMAIKMGYRKTNQEVESCRK